MTKKHYTAIANIIRDCTFPACDEYDGQWYKGIDRDVLVDSLCEFFVKDNPNFDKDKFISYINKQ